MFKKIKNFFSGEKGLGRAVIIGIVIMVIIGLLEFLFNKGNNLYNGIEILKNQTFGEWFRMFFFSVLAGGVVWAFIKLNKKTQDVKSGQIFGFAAALMIFVGIAFGKGCTDKANDGVTSGKGRPGTVQVDSSRIAAEDLLPKK